MFYISLRNNINLLFVCLWCGETNHFKGYGTKQNDHFESINMPGIEHIYICMGGKKGQAERHNVSELESSIQERRGCIEAELLTPAKSSMHPLFVWEILFKQCLLSPEGLEQHFLYSQVWTKHKHGLLGDPT